MILNSFPYEVTPTFKAMDDAFKDAEIIDLVRDYGVVPNRRSQEIDNDIKLSRMRLEIEASGVKVVTLLLPEYATLHYTQNLWVPYGNHCRRVQIIGNNSTVQCNNVANPSGNDGAIGAWAWGLGDHFSPYDHKHVGNGTQATFGYRFETVDAGNVVIQLKSVTDAAKFSHGNRVFLHGKNKQNLGYPPNLEYHEYGIVDTVDLANGRIILRTKIKYSYDDRWHDIAPSYDLSQASGKPRIVNLDDIKKSFALDYYRVTDVHHALSAHPGAPDYTSQYMSTQGAIYCEFVRCSCEGQMAISQNDYVRLIDCQPVNIGDIDKLLGRVVIEGLKTSSSVQPATGADHILLQHGECGDHIRFSSKHFVINDMDIIKASKWGGIILEASSTNITGKIENVRMHYDDDVIFIIQAPTDRRFIPERAVSYHIFSNVTPSSANDSMLSLIPGDIISDVNQVNWARINKVTYDHSKSRFDIEHTSSHSFSGEVVLIPSGKLEINNIQVISPKNPKYENMLWKIPFFQHQHTNKNAVFEGILDGQADFRATIKYVGIVNRIRFTLITPAISSDPNHLYELSISDRGEYYASPVTNIVKIFSGQGYEAGEFVEFYFLKGTIVKSSGWSNTAHTPADLSGISRTCTFMHLDVMKPANQGGGGLAYKKPVDCPRFKVEVWGDSIVN